MKARAGRLYVSPEQSLAVLHPALAAEWHPTRNGPLTPADVIPRSSELVFWQCPTDPSHAWQTQVYSRLRGPGCPACAGQRATPETSLRALRPDIAACWHPTKNGALTPDEVMSGSGRKVWWRCAANPRHVWEAKVVMVTHAKRGGCPFCAGRRATPETSLRGCFPEIAAEWHPTKNGALRPEDVTWRSSRRVFWKCGACRHVWQTPVSRRGASGAGCPACAGRVVTSKNSLAARFPELARQWHPTKNGALTPEAVIPGSPRRIAWRCTKDPSHEWETTVNARTTQGTGCPFCAGKRATPETSLAALHPAIAAEWHRERNAPLKPQQLRPGSQHKAWWRCGKDPAHVWQSVVSSRTRLGAGCPFCAGTVVTQGASLAALHPGVAREWHREKNAPLTPWEVSPGSGRKVWWRCSVKPSHSWEARIYNRVATYATGCPICSGHKTTPDNSLRSCSPALAAEWHPTKNHPLTPDDVVPGSNRRIWWLCPVDPEHVWEAIVKNRSRKGQGCPYCSGRRS